MTFEQWLQSRLTAHGFAVGGIDGHIGKTTIAGLKAFQKAKGIRATGKADEVTVVKLRESASGPAGVIPIRDRETETTRHSLEIFPRQRDVARVYGKVGTNQTRITPPWRMRLAWDKRRYIKAMTLHEKVADSASRVLERVLDHFDQDGIERLGLDLFGGSLNVRRMRGGTKYSMHSWGIAIDFDPERNQLRWTKPRARLSANDALMWWKIWEGEGWTSLGRERDFDWMHVQAARL